MALALFFLLLTLLTTAALLAFLLKSGPVQGGPVQGMNVWLLAALLPLLAALSASMSSQARAARLLEQHTPQPTTVNIITSGRLYQATLNAQDAACLERNTRLHWQGHLTSPQGFIPLNDKTIVRGPLPATAVVEALSIRGQLKCPAFKARTQQH